MNSGTWKVRCLYRSGSVTTAARDLARYKLDLVGAQNFKWDKGGMVRAGITFFFHGKRYEIHHLVTQYFVPHRRVSADKGVEFVRDRMS
jgi:hypothetical protein